MKRRDVLLLAGTGLLAGCSSIGSTDAGAKRREIDGAVDRAVGELVTNARGARGLIDKAQAVLVFPQVLTVGLVAGGSYGEGALRKGPQTLGYYSIGSGSVGLLAGAQTKALYVLFMTGDALQRFQAGSGWTAGADASVVMLDAGAEVRMDTSAAQAPVIALVRSQQGLMANLSLDGTKFTRLDL
jgi:lipid-binding SYLF domain-containing protein